jgi:hypothetical protein
MPRAIEILVIVFMLGVVSHQLLAKNIDIVPHDRSSRANLAASRKDNAPAKVLSSEEWRRVDAAVDRGLAFLASQQLANGSFPSMDHAQPAVTSLCVLAFMANGHSPGEGEYGKRLERAKEFIVSCQRPNGLVTLYGPEGANITRDVDLMVGTSAAYNHAISSLTLSQAYGMIQTKRSASLQPVIRKAVSATLQMQKWPKDQSVDRGGWRYVNDFNGTDSDLSVTGWQLMFLRSARDAGFPVPKEAIDDAVEYIRRSFDKEYGSFVYNITGIGERRTRGMAGAGILALGHAGFHNSVEAQRAGQWLMQYPFDVYNDSRAFPGRDRYHYSLFMCCQGMYQLGSPYWGKFFPSTVRVALDHQQPDGSWEAEKYKRDRQYGNSYTSALVILSLGAANQLLPIFQR